MDSGLKQYIEDSILPMYDDFDAAHRRDHVDMVIEQSMEIARGLDVNEDMVYAIAAYHDIGLVKDRRTHHIVSGEIILEDAWLKEWFNDEQIEVMAQAVEDHRASSDHEPRSIYGRIVAEADRFIDPDQIIIRTVQYGLEHYPELDKEGHYKRTLAHMHEKYADGGYLKLWFLDSPNAARLEALRAIIRDEQELRARFNAVYSHLKKVKLYLDIDGVLLTTKNTRAAKGISQFLDYVTEAFDCYWLTTHCKGDSRTAIAYLSQFLDTECLNKCRMIKPTIWDSSKLDGIDTSDFIWLEDNPFVFEKNMLERNGDIDSLIQVNLNNIDSLTELIPILENRRLKYSITKI